MLTDFFIETEIDNYYSRYFHLTLSSIRSNLKMTISFLDTLGMIVLDYSLGNNLKQKVYNEERTEEDSIVNFFIHKNPKDFLLDTNLTIEDVDIKVKEGITKDELNNAIHLLTHYVNSFIPDTERRRLNIGL